MKYCTKCGNAIEGNGIYCNHCGQKVIGAPDELHCPKCNSSNIRVEISTHEKGYGCLTILFYIILACTIVGIPIMILILLLKKRKYEYSRFIVCNQCGYTGLIKPKTSLSNKISKYILFIILFILIIMIIAVNQ